MANDPDFTLHTWRGDERDLARFAELLSYVYKKVVKPEHMVWKHGHNPVRQSLITYAQNSAGEMVAARAFWPMFSEAAPIYQPCDTVTRPDFQRRGLFSKLTRMCLDEIESDAAVVNFPNANSYPAYLKLGWQLYSDNQKVFSVGLGLGQRPIEDLDDYLKGKVSGARKAYLCWRFSLDSCVSYKLYSHSKGLIVSNGEFNGFVSFHPQSNPYVSAGGFSKGYIVPGHFSTITGIANAAVALKCSSRTAYFLKPEASVETLEQMMKLGQINTFMDTF